MLRKSLLAALAAGLALEVVASPVAHDGALKRDVPATHALHERHAPHWGRKWAKRAKVPGHAVLPMRIGLKQSNMEAGHEKLMDL